MFTIEVEEDRTIVLKKVYTGVTFESAEGERFSICMRDTGFEFTYAGQSYEAKNGVVNVFPIKSPDRASN
jgi:hypothetical protein